MAPIHPKSAININKEVFEQRKIGVGIGSGGVYSGVGLGVLQRLEMEGLTVSFVGGVSGGAIMAALYFLEGSAQLAQKKLLAELPKLNAIKLRPWGPPVSGEIVRNVVEDLLDGRDWNDGKIEGICFAAAYSDTKEPVILTERSRLSLTDSVLASISLKMIAPGVRLKGRMIAHGGDPDYIKGLKDLGAGFVIEVSPNTEFGVLGKIAQFGNILSGFVIGKGDYFKVRRVQKARRRERGDFGIHPNLSLRPPISPLNFNEKNVNHMIEQGRILMDKSILRLKAELM